MSDLERYIATADPEVLHQFALGWNWDGGIDPLRQIIRRRDCDKGTALLIYWCAGPRWFAQYESRDDVSEYEYEQFDLITEIEQRYLAGFYVRQEIRFDPRNDEGFDLTTGYQDIIERREIPAMLFMVTPGQELVRVDIFDESE